MLWDDNSVGKVLSVFAGIISDLSTRYSDVSNSISIVPYSAKKFNIIIEATGGAANDVVLYSTRGEFLPGFLG